MELTQLQTSKPLQEALYAAINNQQYNNYPPPPYLQYTPGPVQPENRMSEFGAEVNQLKNEKPSRHCKTLVGMIILIAGLVTGFVLYFATDVGLSLPALIIICVACYLLYLILACCCNSLSQYLSDISMGQNLETDYESIRNRVGTFEFHAQCYHYETREQTRTVTDSDGNTREQVYTVTEKVVTHTATQTLTPTHTRDQSGLIDQIRASTNIVFIDYWVNYRFRDERSQRNFDNFYNRFKARNTRDQQQDFSCRYTLLGLIQRKTYFVGKLSCNFRVWYYILGLVGMLWPYSMWVESKITRFRIDNMKVVTI